MYTNVNQIIYAAANSIFIYTKTLHPFLYFLDFHVNNDAIFCSILQLCKISGPIFSYSKKYTDEFIS